jgi:hypothetical protein
VWRISAFLTPLDHMRFQITGVGHVTHYGFSRTAYDVLRVGAWSLVIVCGLFMVAGLIGYWSAERRIR